MYVKVHKSGNKWFRDDNGALVGTEIQKESEVYKYLSKKKINGIFLKGNMQKYIITVRKGYIDKYGKFRKVTSNYECSYSTYGFYVFVLD